VPAQLIIRLRERWVHRYEPPLFVLLDPSSAALGQCRERTPHSPRVPHAPRAELVDARGGDTVVAAAAGLGNQPGVEPYSRGEVGRGAEGRRLAVECDGDRFHGPGQWQDDMARQRVLERAGWTFWRCFASSFVRRREEVLEDLMATMQRLGIEPLGAESVDNTVWVHHKEVDPYGVEEKQEIE